MGYTFSHESGFKHGDKVHTTTPNRWGQNFTVQYIIPKGAQRPTWRLLAADGSELRLKTNAWAIALRHGWVDQYGKPMVDSVPMNDADLDAAINKQRGIICAAEFRIKEIEAERAQRVAMRETKAKVALF